MATSRNITFTYLHTLVASQRMLMDHIADGVVSPTQEPHSVFRTKPRNIYTYDHFDRIDCTLWTLRGDFDDAILVDDVIGVTPSDVRRRTFPRRRHRRRRWV